MPDKPWIFRTYAGHSAAHDSNALYRKNLAKGQTGLSIAFDLPTQTGYDSDHSLARGEVGKVGVPIAHLGDMRTLFEGIPQNDINKEYLSRGTYVLPPSPSLRLTKDVILFTTRELPKWNPMNVCSYHL